MRRYFLAFFLFLAGAALTPASGADVARFYSLKSNEVNMREGPSNNHRVKWIYRRKGLPVETLAQYEVWRRVRDRDGEIGWIHVALLSTQRTAVISGQGNAPVRARDDLAAPAIAFAQPGAIGTLKHCGPLTCEIDFNGVDGWVDRSRLWGMDDDEQF